ncbi:hypothetical protein LZZ50_12685 [Xanthomonas arboricola]|uniref:hypothetical protein n=1 Tax=Xanthomonas arboricola TaxID=56448 RepID=UPI001FD6E2C4|nr:hypothetical protein [Xanthomonas arboricola]UOS97413.1 hypothetical protein LZZ50_12685 [Xanthomonas arboricola]
MSSSELWLCIAQLGRSMAALDSDSRNPKAAEAVATLLRCDGAGIAPIDGDCDDPDLTRLLILPELSLAWDDWATVDAAVKSYNKPLVLIAGFGFTKAGLIKEQVPFLNAGVSNERNVNFGCAWLQLPAKGELPALSAIHYYCKNFAEQSVEAPNFDPYLGSEHIVLAFEDCSIAPVICADLLADSQIGKLNAVDKLKAYRLKNGRPVIVAASVLQGKPWHNIWSSRIDRTVDSDLILALANYSHENRPASYADDGNRNLSGAYARSGLISHASPQSVVCNGRDHPTSKGIVLRDSCQIFAAGVLRVDGFSPTTGRHLWISRWGQQFANGTFEPVSTRLKFEIPRLCNRTRHFAPSNGQGITEVAAHLAAASDLRKKGFFLSLIDGPESKNRDPDPASNNDLNDASEIALAVTDALIRADFLQWPADEKVTLDVNITSTDGGALFTSSGYVWRSPSETWSIMAAKLQAYAQDPAPQSAIVVFGEDMNGVEVTNDDVSLGRDTTQPLAAFDPAAPRPDSNTVIVVPFSKAKRLSSLITAGMTFDTQANAIRTSIIESTGLADA